MSTWKAGTANLRTVEGVQLNQTPDGWHGVIDGVDWFFLKKEDRLSKPALWRGYTANHVTGCGLHFTLKSAVRWIKDNKKEIQQKLKERRAAKAAGAVNRVW